mgnify:CR=1 FL=1
MIRRVITLGALATLALAATLGAQQTGADTASPDTSAAAPGARRRALLEQQFRLRLGQVVRQQLQLTDDQYAQLQRVNQKYEAPGRELNQRERYLRLSLRAELRLGQQADQSKVSGYLDQLSQVQQSRLQLFRDEQRDLAGFLTPVQRAKYSAIQEQLRKRLTQMRQRQLQRAAGEGGARVRPRRPRSRFALRIEGRGAGG